MVWVLELQSLVSLIIIFLTANDYTGILFLLKTKAIATHYTRRARRVWVVSNARRQDWKSSWDHLQCHGSVCLGPVLTFWGFEGEEETPHDRKQYSLSPLYPSWLLHILHSDFCLEMNLKQLQVAWRACFKAGFEVEKETLSRAFIKSGNDEWRCLIGRKRNSPWTLSSPPPGSSSVGMVPS